MEAIMDNKEVFSFIVVIICVLIVVLGARFIYQSIRIMNALDGLVMRYAYEQEHLAKLEVANIKDEFRGMVERYPLQAEIERLVYVRAGIIPKNPHPHLSNHKAYKIRWSYSLKNGFGKSGSTE